MSWGSVRLKPGVNVEQTPTLLEAGIAQSSNIRFRDGLVEKLGGWAKFYPFTVSGVPKALHAWSDLNNVNHLAVGTTSQLGVITSGSLQDVTPQTELSQGLIGTAAGAGQINFSTTNGSNVVVVVDTNILNLTTLDFVFFETPIYITGSGIVLAGLYQITQINGPTTYQINAAIPATGTVNNSGHVPIFTTTAGSATISVEIDAHGISLASGPQQVVFPIVTSNLNVTASITTTTMTVTATSANTIQTGLAVSGTGVTAGTSITAIPTVSISSGTYNSGTGAVSLTLSSTGALAPGAPVNVTGLTGTGSFASLDGVWTCTAGTGGTTVNFTGPTGLTLTITGGNVAAAGGVGLYTVNNSQTVGSESMVLGEGVSILGAYSVLSITDANHFTISGNSQATSTGTFSMNGGQVQLLYYINLGPPAVGAGYGLGGYGLGGYGTGVVPSSQTGINISAIDWSLGNWGEILISNPKNGGVYQFDPTGGFTNSGLLNNAPIFNTGMLIAMPQQQIVTFGSTIQTALGPLQDPLLVRWSDVSNFNVWTASSTTQAGSFRLSPGSMIVGGRLGPNNILLWTDLDFWTMSYLGPPLVWGFNKVNGGAGLIGLHAHCELMGTTYWMSQSNLHQAGPGGVGIMHCPVWDAIFQNLNTGTDSTGLPNTRKCWAWANTAFSEVWFFYPSAAGNGECDSFVKYNQLNGEWDYGPNTGSPISRSYGINQSVLGPPIAATPTGIIYQHEVSPDADMAPLSWNYTTGYFMIGEGEESAFVDLIIPDFKFGLFKGTSQNAAIQMSFNLVDDPSGTINTFGPFTVSSTTPEISDLRLRGRMMSFTFSGNDIGTFSRLGRVRYRWAPDGKHP